MFLKQIYLLLRRSFGNVIGLFKITKVTSLRIFLFHLLQLHPLNLLRCNSNNVVARGAFRTKSNILAGPYSEFFGGDCYFKWSLDLLLIATMVGCGKENFEFIKQYKVLILSSQVFILVIIISSSWSYIIHQKKFVSWVRTGRNGGKLTISNYYINKMKIIQLFPIKVFVNMKQIFDFTKWSSIGFLVIRELFKISSG